MEKKLISSTFLVDLNLGKQEINLDKLMEACKEANLQVEYNPEIGFKAVQIKLKPFYFSVFRTGKITIYISDSINETDFDNLLTEIKSKIKACLSKQ